MVSYIKVMHLCLPSLCILFAVMFTLSELILFFVSHNLRSSYNGTEYKDYVHNFSCWKFSERFTKSFNESILRQVGYVYSGWIILYCFILSDNICDIYYKINYMTWSVSMFYLYRCFTYFFVFLDSYRGTSWMKYFKSSNRSDIFVSIYLMAYSQRRQRCMKTG